MASENNNAAAADDDEEEKYIILISAEGWEFYLEKQVATSCSATICTTLEGGFREAEEGIVRFPDLAGYILERVVRYLHYKYQHSSSTSRIPDFIIEPEIALKLMIAAEYLDC